MASISKSQLAASLSTEDPWESNPEITAAQPAGVQKPVGNDGLDWPSREWEEWIRSLIQ
jgi:hypothetical protein